MIKNGKTKQADAELMLDAAKSSGDEEQIEIATAAGTAAAHHLIELTNEKKALLTKVKNDQMDLGEERHDITTETEKLKYEKIQDHRIERDLGEQQAAADEEGATSPLQHKIDVLTMKLEGTRYSTW